MSKSEIPAGILLNFKYFNTQGRERYISWIIHIYQTIKFIFCCWLFAGLVNYTKTTSISLDSDCCTVYCSASELIERDNDTYGKHVHSSSKTSGSTCAFVKPNGMWLPAQDIVFKIK